MKNKNIFKTKYFLIILLFLVIYFIFYLIFEWKTYSAYILNDISIAPKKTVAIVFGASVKSSIDMPSDVLADRIKTAYELYKNEKIEKVFLSGDGRDRYYNEVKVMKSYALKLGFHESDIEIDQYGINTFNTCYRAKKFFGIKDAILVTQSYHLNRALQNCISIGIESIGVSSDLNNYQDIVKFNIREIFAFAFNWFKVLIYK